MQSKLRLALFQPDMPPNTGAMIRLCACFNIGLDIIEPCGFVWDDRKLKRVAMDYIEHVDFTRHASWESFKDKAETRRIVLLTTKAETPFHHFSYRSDDILMVGRESAGVPGEIHESLKAKVLIPMQKDVRSINVSMAAAIVLSEALRQTEGFP